MKRTLLLLFVCLFVQIFSQTKQAPERTYQNPLLMTPFGGMKPNSGFFTFNDSLTGFNADAIEQDLLARGLAARERFGYMETVKRNFIKQKYGLNVVPNSTPVASGKHV